MAADITYFRTRFPEFEDETDYPDARIQLFLDDAAEDMGDDETRWCNKYDRAQSYLAAHYLIVGTTTEAGSSGASVGPISNKSAGGVSVTKSVVAKDRSDGDDFYTSTSYGLQFITIRNACFVGVATANIL